jgi:MoaA/NifB/PqqE/SkfB family radical SAM enzyme
MAHLNELGSPQLDWVVESSERRRANRGVASYRATFSAGGLVLPPDEATRWGLTPGAEVLVDVTPQGLRLRNPVSHLARVYIEPTNCCNLTCRTCVRNNWEGVLGHMAQPTFERIIDGLKSFPLPLTVFFGGFGEPLSHPHIIQMIGQAKAMGASVAMITNGTLLSAERSRQLLDVGLDTLWVSLDGATAASYSDVRLAESLPRILENLTAFHNLRVHAPAFPDLGIAFVAMKRNINDLPALLCLGQRLGANRYSISGVLAHTEEMRQEVLYALSLSDEPGPPSTWAPQISLPRMDIDQTTRDVLFRVLRNGRNISLGGADLNASKNRCPFIESGVTAIGWDGGVSPCLPLLHTNNNYLGNRQRLSMRHTFGNVNESDLDSIWSKPEYVAFRRRVQAFQFSPCAFCGGCDLGSSNQEDCFGNEAPTCGGCLWAQGVIQCP